MKKQLIAAAAACAMTVPAFAQGESYVDGFFALSKVDFDPGPDDDGNGFGLKGAFQVANQAFLAAEYQTVEFDDFNADLDQIRLGGIFGPGAGSRGEGVYGQVEYVDFDFDDGEDQDGLGAHVGYSIPISPEFRVYGQGGYLLLDDVDGPEFLAGGTFQVAQNIAIFADYRLGFLDVDNGGDLDTNDFRVGARFLF
mgnify:FL=1|tara:strand:- start:2568 stop:3155 length:588 start_codon:yes stop_codon:yes gene_type:complete